MTIKRWKTQKRRGGNRVIDAYKYILSSFAYSDAKHDFSNVSGYRGDFYSDYKHTIQTGIPISNHTEYTENGLIQSINITHVNDYPNTDKFTIDTIINTVTNSTNIDLLINNTIHREYRVAIVYYQKNNDIQTDVDYLEVALSGKRVFVIDSVSMKFLDGFKNNNNTSLYDPASPYYILYNRETENDPANKVRLERRHFEQKGYCLQSVHDIDNRDVVYSHWSNRSMIYSNMFYSNHTFTLHKRDNTIYLKVDNLPQEYEITRYANSPSKLIETMNDTRIGPSMVFQRKRSGDCFQALSVFKNTRELSINHAQHVPKMLITLDRMLLYYSLLMGIDVGFTAKRGTGDNQDYYLITFVNDNDSYSQTESPYNYSRNRRRGGKVNNRKKSYTMKKLIRNMTRTSNRQTKMLRHNLNTLYNDAIPLELAPYAYSLSYLLSSESEDSIVYMLTNMADYISDPIRKQHIVTYVTFLHRTSFDNEYVSNIVNMLYTIESTYGLDRANLIDTSYYDILSFKGLGSLRFIYKIPRIDAKLREVVESYEIRDKSFATYIKSIHSLLWIIRKYSDIVDDIGFNDCDYDTLQGILTDSLAKQLTAEQIDDDEYQNTERGRLERMGAVIRQHDYKYRDIYETVFTTADWDLKDFSRIVYYIDKHDADAFTVLNRLSADYSWAMSLPVKQPGIQSVSIMILGDLGYSFDMRMDRTPDVQAMIDEIYAIPAGFSLKDFHRSLDVLLRLYKRTVEKHLVWGSRLF